MYTHAMESLVRWSACVRVCVQVVWARVRWANVTRSIFRSFLFTALFRSDAGKTSTAKQQNPFHLKNNVWPKMFALWCFWARNAFHQTAKLVTFDPRSTHTHTHPECSRFSFSANRYEYDDDDGAAEMVLTLARFWFTVTYAVWFTCFLFTTMSCWWWITCRPHTMRCDFYELICRYLSFS